MWAALRIRAAASLAAHALEGLRGEHDGGTVGAHDLDQPGHALAVGDRGELVDDQQHLPSLLLAAGEVLLEVLDQEARELGRLLAVEQLVEQQVAAVGVLERPVAVELAGGRRRRRRRSAGGRRRCARAEGVDLRRARCRPRGRRARSVSSRGEQLRDDARRAVRSGAGEPDEVD